MFKSKIYLIVITLIIASSLYFLSAEEQFETKDISKEIKIIHSK